MLIFGHLGIGAAIVRPWTTGLSKRLVYLGALLPDLIDKPLYYGLSFATGKSGLDLGLISGTRTFGHTAMLLLAMSIIAVWRQSKALAALAFGMASHLLLDHIGDRIVAHTTPDLVAFPDADPLRALLWPFMGWQFPVAHFASASEHLHFFDKPFYIVAEIVGAGLIGWDIWKNRHESEILSFIRTRRLLMKHRRSRRKGFSTQNG